MREEEALLAQEEKRLTKKLYQLEEKNKMLYFGHPGKGYLGRYGKWEPNPIQKQCFKAFENPAKRIILMAGGNQIGKTLAETAVIMATCRGHWPWETYDEVGAHIWETHNWEPPIRIRWVGQGWEQHIQKVLVEKGIEELWPSDWKISSKKNNLGVKHIFRDELTGSEIQIMSADQDVTKFEGWTGHLCCYDEPIPRNIFVANERGLIANKGKSLMGATLLNQGWITQDIINRVDKNGIMDKSVSYFTAGIRVNEGFGLDKEGIDHFESQLTDEEKAARIEGIPVFMSSLVLRIDREQNIIPRIDKLPFNWMVDVAIDIGVAKPHDLTFLATDEKGMKYIIFDEVVRGDGSEIGNYIIDKMKTYRLRINRIITDPLAKSDRNNENTTWDKIDLVLNRHDLYLECGSKYKSDGVILINSYLKTINKMPALFFFEDCNRAIKQCLNWSYDKKTGEPSKSNDDQCENLYRLILLDTKYEEPFQNLDSVTSIDRRHINKRTGY